MTLKRDWMCLLGGGVSENAQIYNIANASRASHLITVISLYYVCPFSPTFFNVPAPCLPHTTAALSGLVEWLFGQSVCYCRGHFPLAILGYFFQKTWENEWFFMPLLLSTLTGWDVSSITQIWDYYIISLKCLTSFDSGGMQTIGLWKVVCLLIIVVFVGRQKLISCPCVNSMIKQQCVSFVCHLTDI